MTKSPWGRVESKSMTAWTGDAEPAVPLPEWLVSSGWLLRFVMVSGILLT